MKTYYKPVATYNAPEDIIGLFPSSTLKGDEGDIVIRYYLKGEGKPLFINTCDEDALYTEAEIMGTPDFIFTSGGGYAVRFQRGSAKLLRQGNDMHGFYIDIYERVGNSGSTDKSLAVRILNLVSPYIPDDIRETIQGIISKEE